MDLLFITHYYAPDSGAAANRLTRLAERLQQRGHRVTVLTTLPHYPTGVVPPAYRGRWTVIEERGGVRVIQVWLWTTRSPKIMFRLLSQISFMLTCILRGLFVRRPDAIFIENQPVFTGLAGWVISRLKRRPYLMNVSDYWPEYLVIAGVVSEHSRVYRLFRALTNRTQRDAAQLVILVPGLRESIQARLPAAPPITLIYNALDLDLYRPGDPDTPNRFRQRYAPNGERLLTFLGGLGPHIDLPTMLDAARILGERTDLRILFVGTGAQKDALLADLEDPAFAHCQWIEWLDAADLPDFWQATDITFWALHDNPLDKLRFQAKLFEALASGTPPVVAVEGLMSDFFTQTQTGFSVAPDDAAALAAAITRLLDDTRLYTATAQRGRDYAAEHFDLTRHVDAYETLLQEVADRA